MNLDLIELVNTVFDEATVKTPPMTLRGGNAVDSYDLPEYAEAEKAAGMRLTNYDGGGLVNDRCYYVRPEDRELQIGLMISGGEVVRVDIWSDSQIKTLSGAGIGDSEARIFALYPNRIEVREHPYLGKRGNYLTFVPNDAVDRDYRVVFETVEGYVRQYRAGQLPQVGHIEGCN